MKPEQNPTPGWVVAVVASAVVLVMAMLWALLPWQAAVMALTAGCSWRQSSGWRARGGMMASSPKTTGEVILARGWLWDDVQRAKRQWDAWQAGRAAAGFPVAAAPLPPGRDPCARPHRCAEAQTCIGGCGLYNTQGMT